MEKKISKKNQLLSFLTVIALTVVALKSKIVLAVGLSGWTRPPLISNVPTDIDQAIVNITNWILGFVAMVAVLMLIWGGVNYLTSAGDEQKAETAKKTIKWALIGLVIAGLAYAIVVVIVTVILSN